MRPHRTRAPPRLGYVPVQRGARFSANAIALAEKIAANGPLAVAATKRIIVESRSWTPESMWAEQNKILMPVFSSNDAKEGAIAFAEKRAPRWTGT